MAYGSLTVHADQLPMMVHSIDDLPEKLRFASSNWIRADVPPQRHAGSTAVVYNCDDGVNVLRVVVEG